MMCRFGMLVVVLGLALYTVQAAPAIVEIEEVAVQKVHKRAALAEAEAVEDAAVVEEAAEVAGEKRSASFCNDMDSDNCAGWKEANYCVTQADLMSYYCAATCGLCGDLKNNLETGTEIFTDVVEVVQDVTNTDTPAYDNYDSYDNSYDNAGYGEKGETSNVVNNLCAGEIKNGKLSNARPSEYGSVECDEGFTRMGSYYVYCDERGIIADLPTCERKCAEIEVEQGNVVPPEGDQAGWLYITCNDGYTLEGNFYVWCEKGVAEGLPKCVGGGAAGGSSAKSDAMEESSYDNYDYSTESAEYDPALDPSIQEPSTTTNYGVYDGCKLNTVEKGEWTNPYRGFTYWVLQCNKGYKYAPGGDEYVYCNPDKSVLGQQATCVKDPNYDYCAETVIKNGGVKTGANREGWAWTEVVCNKGYSLVGEKGTYCDVKDGGLSKVLGECLEDLE